MCTILFSSRYIWCQVYFAWIFFDKKTVGIPKDQSENELRLEIIEIYCQRTKQGMTQNLHTEIVFSEEVLFWCKRLKHYKHGYSSQKLNYT